MKYEQLMTTTKSKHIKWLYDIYIIIVPITHDVK